MTMTTDAPTWINVDLLAPPELRAEISDLTACVKEAHHQLAEFGERFLEISRHIETVTSEASRQLELLVTEQGGAEWDAGDAVWNLVNTTTGYRALFDAMSDLTELVDPDNYATRAMAERQAEQGAPDQWAADEGARILGESVE